MVFGENRKKKKKTASQHHRSSPAYLPVKIGRFLFTHLECLLEKMFCFGLFLHWTSGTHGFLMRCWKKAFFWHAFRIWVSCLGGGVKFCLIRRTRTHNLEREFLLISESASSGGRLFFFFTVTQERCSTNSSSNTMFSSLCDSLNTETQAWIQHILSGARR